MNKQAGNKKVIKLAEALTSLKQDEIGIKKLDNRYET